ncbi:MAG: prephenate dehydrogenase/arogenate dehydrogenase family protein [Planctomycetaceae bacterium]|nr:prephenate dehydrogenase/arogenate dehydrogenase family protein [Planctomycetaceae bacterium]
MSRPALNSAAFETLTIVGVGLLGGPVALAAKQRGLVRRVIGVGRSAARLEHARTAGLIDDIRTDLAQAAAQAELLIFATPVNLIVPGVREAAAACRPGTLITDVGSTKSYLCRELANGLPNGVTFVGSHPLAGSEKQGWEHARADLFEGRVCVVTPIESSSRNTVERLTAFWRAIGMSVLEMSPEAHDRALAQSSHVPHVVASALAQTLADENRSLAATGFADTTRIAAGDPEVWVPILMDNRDAVLTRLDEFSSQVAAFREALAHGDADELRHLWERGKAIREQLQVRRVAE